MGLLLLGLDFETTWTEPVNTKQARITEIGAVLFDWERLKPLEIYSKLVWDSSYPKSPFELIQLTGITDEMLENRGIKPATAFNELNTLMLQCDHVVAHNGTGFDKPIYQAECDRHGIQAVKKPWIDTKIDIKFPPTIKSRSLVHLAAEHGFVNPFSHRALFDVLSMFKILERYSLVDVLKLSQEPMVYSIAKVSYEDRDKAKRAGYYWDGDNKRWFKPMKKSQFIEEEKKVSFHVLEVDAPTI